MQLYTDIAQPTTHQFVTLFAIKTYYLENFRKFPNFRNISPFFTFLQTFAILLCNNVVNHAYHHTKAPIQIFSTPDSIYENSAFSYFSKFENCAKIYSQFSKLQHFSSKFCMHIHLYVCNQSPSWKIFKLWKKSKIMHFYIFHKNSQNFCKMHKIRKNHHFPKIHFAVLMHTISTTYMQSFIRISPWQVPNKLQNV